MANLPPTTNKHPTDGQTFRGTLGLTFLGGLFLLTNSLLPLVVDRANPPPSVSAFLISIAGGVIASEALILLTWIVFGDGSWLKRASLFFLAGAALVSAWFLSMSIFFFNTHLSLRREFYRFDLAWIPLTSVLALAGAIPMYGWRLLFGWHLARFDDRPSSKPIAIAGLLVFIAFTAAVLSMVQWLIGASSARNAINVWRGLGITSGFVAAAVATLALPMLVLTTSRRHTVIRGWLTIAIGLCLLWALAAILVVANSGMARQIWPILMIVTGAYVGSAACYWMFLASLRQLGYRGTWRSRSDQHSPRRESPNQARAID